MSDMMPNYDGYVYERLTYDNFDNYPLETIFDTYSDRLRRIGQYVIGPRLVNMPIRSLTQFIARKDKTNEFYTVKILTLNEELSETDIRNGKMLLYTEFSLLNLLKGEEGVIQHHGIVKDIDYLSNLNNYNLSEESTISNFKPRKVICLVLDFLTSHQFQTNYEETSSNCVNLQQYVIRERRLSERQSVVIMRNVCRVLVLLHNVSCDPLRSRLTKDKKNIVHRDLKLGNLILNKRNASITLTNFCLGRQIINDDDLLVDKRGSPAYIAPDVLMDKPYKGKPVDVWAMGVVFYSMLYGEFPFYDQTPSELFRKIKAAVFKLPKCSDLVSKETSDLIKKVLHTDHTLRFTAHQTLDYLNSIIWKWQKLSSSANDVLQMVPVSQIDADLIEANQSKGRKSIAKRIAERHYETFKRRTADTLDADDTADSSFSSCHSSIYNMQLMHENRSPRLRRSHSTGGTNRHRANVRGQQSTASLTRRRSTLQRQQSLGNAPSISPTPVDIPSNVNTDITVAPIEEINS